MQLFLILPAWGLNNAAAWLFGQHHWAYQPAMAERSVNTTCYKVYFTAFVTVFFVAGAPWMIRFTKDAVAVSYAVFALG
jgi:Na+-driven multidrug efflux pump